MHQRAWDLARRQHWVISRAQLLALGFDANAIAHRLRNGRLHPVFRGVYAVGHPEPTQLGWWMAAVLACGERAVLSHASAAALWGIRPLHAGPINISLPSQSVRRPSGVKVHRRPGLQPHELTRREGIPVTTVTCTLVDLAARLDRDPLEAAINEADSRGLTTPKRLRDDLETMSRRPGLKPMRDLLDRRTFNLTESKLERLFLPIADRAGQPRPVTKTYVNGFKVDFYFPEIGLVVETDGGSFHRTPAQQTRDRLRDQTHAAAGLTALRFTHAQVRYEPDHVERILRNVAAKLSLD